MVWNKYREHHYHMRGYRRGENNRIETGGYNTNLNNGKLLIILFLSVIKIVNKNSPINYIN